MENISKRQAFWLLCIVAVFTMIPFLGVTDFHTKGEPREAIVAYSMLETGNWILPENNGGDMAYKPPFFHWCIAGISVLCGAVTESTSRMPSALALIGMVLGVFGFLAKRVNVLTALLTAFILLTGFEVHRAGFACRVDMVLTALMVGAILLLYKWYERDLRGLPWLAMLLMGAAVLTKGPVGIILPCGCVGLFLLLRGYCFGKLLWKCLLVAVLSFSVPAVWYYLAYLQGGKEFIDLMLEENVGRFLGRMSYGSHERPFTYNFTTVVAGYLPWTFLAFFSLFALKYGKLKDVLHKPWIRLKSMDSVRLYALVTIVVIFVFYCIPKSKRSVYLLPIYPFIAYFFALFCQYLWANHRRVLKAYGLFLGVLVLLLSGVFVAVRFGWIPETIFKGKHAAENVAYMQALQIVPMTVFRLLCILLPVAAFVYFLRCDRQGKSLFTPIFVMLFALYVALDGFYQPAVLNEKSDKAWALEVKKIVPEGNIYYYMSVSMLRFYVVNFYNGNRVVSFENNQPKDGYMLVTQRDYETYILPKYADDYSFTETLRRWSPELSANVYLYRFSKK